MSKRDHTNSRPKRRSPYAKDLQDPMFRQRRIKSVKGYDRNDFNSYEGNDMAEEEFNPNEYSSICGDCVKKHEVEPRHALGSTYWTGTCSVCLTENVLCNDVWDWEWPNRTAPYWD